MEVIQNEIESGFYNPGFCKYPGKEIFFPAILHLKDYDSDPLSPYEISFGLIPDK